MLGSVRVSQLIAAVTCVAAVVLFVVFKVLTKKKNIPLFVNSDAWAEQQEEFRLEAEKKAAKKSEKENAPAESILADDADDIDEVRGADIPAEAGDEESAEATETDENDAADVSSDNDDNNDNESED